MNTPYRRAFFFLLDGARTDVFQEFLRAGAMPNISRYLVEPGGYRPATTVFPSVTGVAYVPYLTGLFPGRANIPGYRWFDREHYQKRPLSFMRFRNYYGLGSYLMDRDLSRDAQTMFEMVRPSSNIFSGISRGTGIRRNAAYFRRIPATLEFSRTGSWDHIDDAGERYLLAAARRKRERFTFHTTYSIDEYSHHHGPFSERAKNAYLRFDRALGKLVGVLRSSGQLDSSVFMLGADHGHTEVHEHFDLEKFIEIRGLKTLYFPKQMRRWMNAEAAVMVAGNASGHIYIKGPGRWSERPPVEEHLERDRRLIDDLLAEKAVDHVIYRLASSNDQETAVRVSSTRGSATVRLNGNQVHYTLDRAGHDPFGYAALPEVMTRAQVLQLTAESDYPDAPLQISQIFQSPRSGDLMVSARRGYDLRPREGKTEFLSCHGSLHREHMLVPFAANVPLVDRMPRSADVFPTVLELLGRAVPPNLDGQTLIIPQVAKRGTTDRISRGDIAPSPTI